MICSSSAEQLAALLDSFCVPMFAVERLHARMPFKVLCINAAYETCSGLNPKALRGAQASDYLPKTQAMDVLEHYMECATSQHATRFQQIYGFPSGTVHMDTTLQYQHLPNGRDRLIGTSFETQPVPMNVDQLVLEDIGYFARWADCQLQNLITILDIQQQIQRGSSQASGDASHARLPTFKPASAGAPNTRWRSPQDPQHP